MTNRWRWRWRWACWSQKNKSFVCIVESIGTRAEAGRSETRAHLIYIHICSCAHVGFGPSPNPFLKTKSETIRCVRVGKTKLTSLCSHFNNIKLQYVVYQTHTHTHREREYPIQRIPLPIHCPDERVREHTEYAPSRLMRMCATFVYSMQTSCRRALASLGSASEFESESESFHHPQTHGWTVCVSGFQLLTTLDIMPSASTH